MDNWRPLEAYSLMVTSKRSSRVRRVERGREETAKKGRAPEKHREGGQAKLGRTIEKHRSAEPQEERGDEGKTNAGKKKSKPPVRFFSSEARKKPKCLPAAGVEIFRIVLCT